MASPNQGARASRPAGGGLRLLVAAACWVVVIAGLRLGASVLIPLVTSIFLAMISYPLVGWLQRQRIPAGVAVSATMLGIVAAFIGPGLVIRGTVNRFVQVAPTYQLAIREETLDWLVWLRELGIETGQLVALADPGEALALVGPMFTGAAALLSNVFVILLATGFLLLEAASFGRRFAVALELDEEDLGAFVRVTSDVYRYLWIKTLVSLVTGVVAGLWVALLGVEFAVLWGLLAFLLNYIPNFGSVLAAIPPALLAILQFGPGRTLVLLAGYAVLNMVLGNIVEPSLMGRRLGLSAFVIILALVFWGWVWGAVGLILAVPITMVIRIVLEHSSETRWIAQLLSGSALPSPGDRRAA